MSRSLYDMADGAIVTVKDERGDYYSGPIQVVFKGSRANEDYYFLGHEVWDILDIPGTLRFVCPGWFQ